MKSTWTWNEDEHSHDGVEIQGEELLWFTHSEDRVAGGGARKQSIVDFLSDGPAVSDVPESIIEELNEVIKERSS